jgi:hypothetical protein
MAGFSTSAALDAHIPTPPSERGAWLLAIALGALGVTVLIAVLSGVVGYTAPQTLSAAPPPVPAAVPTPAPASAAGAGAGDSYHATPRALASGGQIATTASAQLQRAAKSPSHGKAASAHAAIVTRPTRVEQTRDLARFVDQTATHISTRWMEGFYPIYGIAQRTFGVNWLLLASIHNQESAFSTDPTTYHGLNFAGCCGGPMQFNVTNGPVSTWQLVSNSYLYGARPAAYNHQTSTHPSLYDDFDSLMAAAHLLSSDGASFALDNSAWNAAYDYYGHDATGVTYADQVLARAIDWSQHGFCINCGLNTSMVAAVHAAYGAPVLSALSAAPSTKSK